MIKATINVLAIETGEVPPGPMASMHTIEQYRETYGGSLRTWVETVRGESCKCTASLCDNVIEVGHGESKIKIWIYQPETVKEKLQAICQDFRGLNRNIQPTTTKATATALHDAEGNRAGACFTCGECGTYHSYDEEGEKWSVTGEIDEKPIYEYATGGFPVEQPVSNLPKHQ
ncbi:hypothetical protein SAMN05216388_10252 [Halorientalis persicus]|uniref:Uncharacterized protein n=1 Tax=Halorientalis persicus TaxID=1367881 RepID=A0A1H8U087_9EURY|nr:hypothetical protein [Halorientalis persicus]SEO96591.1 hypothetical protein SAMN05216388_10252 [Halorientalis persicus]